MGFKTRKDGRVFKERGRSSSATMRSIRAQNKARKATIRSLNYHGGDYTGPNPSRRSILLDRARHNKNQRWEKKRR